MEGATRWGVAIDDQFGFGTAQRRLTQIVDSVHPLGPQLVAVKIDHEAVAVSLSAESSEEVVEQRHRRMIDVLTALGKVALAASPHVHVIIHEGFDGPYEEVVSAATTRFRADTRAVVGEVERHLQAFRPGVAVWYQVRESTS